AGGASGLIGVMNTLTTVTGDVINDGTVKTTNATVTWNGNFTIGTDIGYGAYISDHAKQTFTGDLTVGADGYLVGASQDLFIITGDFINHSTNADNWNTGLSVAIFTKGNSTPLSGHYFYIPGEDNDSPGDVLVTAVTHNFAWGTLNILGQTVHLFDGNTGNNGTAQYVGGLVGAKVNWFTKMVYNIFNDDDDPINIYYDPDLLVNFYLHGLTYDLAGTGGGQLIPFHTPLPPSALLLGSGLLGLGLLGWRRKRG
ncbi:MAG: hypothetical protein P8X58_14030, partial [Syntrophobacterales bacterium]